MTVAELIEQLKRAPQDAEVCVDRGGAYGDAKSVEIYNKTDRMPAQVIISEDEP